MLSDRIGGMISILLGGLSLSEAVRLYPERVSTFVGDYLMPGIVGCGLVLLGVLTLISKGEKFKVEFPEAKVIKKIVFVVVTLFAYWIMLNLLGYTISTFVASIALFMGIGSYPFVKSALYSTIQISAIYLIFVYWLRMPFPTGSLIFW